LIAMQAVTYPLALRFEDRSERCSVPTYDGATEIRLGWRQLAGPFFRRTVQDNLRCTATQPRYIGIDADDPRIMIGV
jgi:hypothetical protein